MDSFKIAGQDVTIEHLKAFSEWPCKAKFRFVDANRFVEISELSSFEELSTKNPSYKWSMHVLETFHVEKTTGHIKIEFRLAEIETSTAEVAAEAYRCFYRLIIAGLDLIEKEFTKGGLKMPQLDIVLLSGFDQVIEVGDRAYIENKLIQ